MRSVRLALAAVVLSAGAAAAQEGRIGLLLDFSPAAEARLVDLGERVTVAAWWWGEPASDRVAVDEIGQVQMASVDTTVEVQRQRLLLPAVPAGVDLSLVVEPMLLVNIYSAREAHEDNLLDCGIVDGPVAELAGRDTALTCRLIGE